MKICRFDDNRLGLVKDGFVHDVTEAAAAIPVMNWPVPQGDAFFRNLDELRPKMKRLADEKAGIEIDGVKFLSPVANPGKIIAAPVNYERHLEESRRDESLNFGATIRTIGEYGVFLKATSSLVGPGEGVTGSWQGRRVDHEIELALVVGKQGHRIGSAEAMSHVAGYMVGLDMTVRGTEDRSFRKSMDTFTVLGPWMVTADEVEDPGDLLMELKVNESPRQSASTRDLIYDISQLIVYASSAYTLFPGDVIMTGTPEGVGPVAPGDTIHARIAQVGEMSVLVRGQ